MRGRILWAGVLAVVLMTACSKKDSLYIDSSKDGAPPAAAPEKATNEAARPAPEQAPPAAPPPASKQP